MALAEQTYKRQALWKKLWHYASVLLALALIGIILRSISLNEMRDALRVLDPGYLLLAYSLDVVIVALLAYRWWVLYGIDERRPPYPYLLKISFVGVFFNNLLPGSFGGDIYRTLHMAQPQHGETQLSRSLAIILLDRLTGLFGLVLIGAAAVLSNRVIDLPGHVGVWTFALLALFGLALYLSMNRRSYELVCRSFFWLPERYRIQVERRIDHLRERVVVFTYRKDLVFVALSVSIGQRVIWFISCYLVGVSLHLDISPLFYFVALPIIEIVRMLPLTVQGIGVREGLYVLFFGAAGVTNSEATLLAVFIYTLLSLNGLVGGAIYLWDRRLVIPARASEK
jgi:uncharacterized protein (TIRG00374 family)